MDIEDKMGGLIAYSQEDYKILTLSMNQVFTVDELKQVKAKNDILMHTEKTYTVTEIAKEPEISNTKPDYGTCTLFSSYRQDILSHHGTFLINLIRVNLSNFPEGDQDGVCSL